MVFTTNIPHYSILYTRGMEANQIPVVIILLETVDVKKKKGVDAVLGEDSGNLYEGDAKAMSNGNYGSLHGGDSNPFC